MVYDITILYITSWTGIHPSAFSLHTTSTPSHTATAVSVEPRGLSLDLPARPPHGFYGPNRGMFLGSTSTHPPMDTVCLFYNPSKRLTGEGTDILQVRSKVNLQVLCYNPVTVSLFSCSLSFQGQQVFCRGTENNMNMRKLKAHSKRKLIVGHIVV